MFENVWVNDIIPWIRSYYYSLSFCSIGLDTLAAEIACCHGSARNL